MRPGFAPPQQHDRNQGTARAAFCTVLIRPSANPKRLASTNMAVAGQMMAGTTEKLMPIIAVEIHRLKCVVPSNRNVRLNSRVPKVSREKFKEQQPAAHHNRIG